MRPLTRGALLAGCLVLSILFAPRRDPPASPSAARTAGLQRAAGPLAAPVETAPARLAAR